MIAGAASEGFLHPKENLAMRASLIYKVRCDEVGLFITDHQRTLTLAVSMRWWRWDTAWYTGLSS